MNAGDRVMRFSGDMGTVQWVSQTHDGEVIAAGVRWDGPLGFQLEFGSDIEQIETVPDAWACPACGENRMDRLANRDGRITCPCGREYDIE